MLEMEALTLKDLRTTIASTLFDLGIFWRGDGSILLGHFIL